MKFLIYLTLIALSYTMFLKQGDMMEGANGVPGNSFIPVAAGLGGEGNPSLNKF
jgi:hypothetical protein